MLLFLVFFLLLEYSYCQFSTFPTWIGNPYLETNSYQVITNFQDTSQSGGANITFQQAYAIPPKVAFAITRYSGDDGLYDEDFYMKTIQVTNLKAEIQMVIEGFTHIRVLNVMYLAVHPDFKYHLNTFNDIQANYSATGPLSLSPINQYTNLQRVFVNIINYTQLCSLITTNHKEFGNNTAKNKVAVYLSGIFNYVRGNPRDYPEIKFDITTQVINNSFFKLQVVVQPTYRVDLLKLSLISMDIQDIQTSRQYTIVYMTDRYYFDHDNYIPLEKQFFNDVFIGMLDFNTQSPMCTIDFNLVFEPDNYRIVAKKSVPHPASLSPNCGLKSARLVTFYMKTWYCPAPYYYFNLDTDMCDDYCASYLYGNATAGQCRPCPTGCIGCDPQNPIVCLYCDALTDFRVLVNDSCQCIQGYYEANNTSNSCTSCSSIVANCSDCKIDSFGYFECNQCQIGTYLENNTCFLCTMVGCSSCTSQSECILCNSTQGYSLVSNKTCQICPFSCDCDGYYLPKLTDAVTGITYCSTICGDGFVRQLQECDDGNFEDGDGCSSKCQVQKYWLCSDDEQFTCCNIDSSLLFIKIDDIEKTKNQNSFQIKSTIYPKINILTSQKLKQSLQVSLAGVGIERQQLETQDIQKIHLKYYYSSLVEKKQCKITFKIQFPQKTNPNCTVSVSSSLIFYPDSSNNLPLMYFDQSLYQISDKIQNVVSPIIYSSYGVMLLSALPCKIIGLELFGVLQLAYFSLALIEDLNLMLVPFIKLASTNGYNPQIFQSNQKLPTKIDYISYDTLFLNNCGFMLAVLVAQILIAFILYVVSLLLKSFPILDQISKRLFKEILLTLLLFNSFNFAFGVGIHFKYTGKNHKDYLLNSAAAILTLLIPLLIAISLLFTKSKQFGQFKNKFKAQKSSQVYFVITIIYRYGLGYYMAIKTDDQSSTLIVISFSLLFLMYNFINLPFKSTLHNYRACVCHLSQFTILFVANYYEGMKSTSSIQHKSQIFSPAYIDITVIGVSILISCIALFYELFSYFKQLMIKFSGNKHVFSSKKISNLPTVSQQYTKNCNQTLGIKDIQQVMDNKEIKLNRKKHISQNKLNVTQQNLKEQFNGQLDENIKKSSNLKQNNIANQLIYEQQIRIDQNQ